MQNRKSKSKIKKHSKYIKKIVFSSKESSFMMGSAEVAPIAVGTVFSITTLLSLMHKGAADSILASIDGVVKDAKGLCL